ncbi:hypothetical protein NQZ68_039178, partial [Dissostichus eleginoides]
PRGQGKETAGKHCGCSSSRSEVLCTLRPFDKLICMLTMLDPAPIAVPGVKVFSPDVPWYRSTSLFSASKGRI